MVNSKYMEKNNKEDISLHKIHRKEEEKHPLPKGVKILFIGFAIYVFILLSITFYFIIALSKQNSEEAKQERVNKILQEIIPSQNPTIVK